MLKKLEEVLGKELSEQVSKLLKEAKVELAIMNDGSVVPAEKHETLKTNYKSLETKYTTDIKKVNDELDKLVKGNEDIDAVKKSLKEYKENSVLAATKFETEKLDIRKKTAVEIALVKANAKENYIDILKGQVDLEKLSFDGDKLIGIEELIKVKQQSFPELFGEIKNSGTPPVGDKQNPPLGDKATLIKKYNEAEKSGDARSMMAIQTAIKKIPTK